MPKNPAYISRYCANLECPNPNCTQTGKDGQKGWIYRTYQKNKNKQHYLCKCHFCGIVFNPHANRPQSWVGRQEKELPTFCFDENVWNLQHFYYKPRNLTISFQTIQTRWYQLEVKEYIFYLLKSKIYSSDNSILPIVDCLRQFGQIITQQRIDDIHNITRSDVVIFLSNCQDNKATTICSKLTNLRNFFEWLKLEASSLIRSRDFPKRSRNDADWLDEITRKAIHENLKKIPVAIARHYLVQEYTAARPHDICLMNFDCLVEENGKFYVKFYQHKTDRWHQILATREIRQVIEEQQKWIRLTFNSDYSYLFCHFWSARNTDYPAFSNLKPLPTPPQTNAQRNQMVRIIRMLIEKEDIHDANGKRPHFTGKITRSSRLQEIRVRYGIEAAQLYADHTESRTTFQYYTPVTKEQVAAVDLPFQELLINRENRFLPWQSLPESLLKNPKAHELDLEIAPRLAVYGHCTLNPKIPCPVNLYPKCYGCSSFRPSTDKLPLYERQYFGEQQRLIEAKLASAELAQEEAKATIEAMDKWLPELLRLNNGENT